MSQDANLSYQDRQRIFLEDFLESYLFTSLPARITSVDSLQSKQSIDVKVAVRRTFRDRAALEGADLLDIPVVFPSGGGGMLSFPLQVGDTVLVIFCKRAMDEWILGDGSDATPQLFRQFDLADAVAIPCLFPFSKNLNPDPDHVMLKFAGSSVTLFNNGDSSVVSPGNINVDAGGNLTATADGNVSVASGGSILLDATTTVTIRAGAGISMIAPNVAISATSMTHNGVNTGSTHTHPQGVDSDGDTQQNTGTPQ